MNVRLNSLYLTNYGQTGDFELTFEDLSENENMWIDMSVRNPAFPVMAKYSVCPTKDYKYGVIVGDELSPAGVHRLVKQGRIDPRIGKHCSMNRANEGYRFCVPDLHRYHARTDKQRIIEILEPNTSIIIPDKKDFVSAHKKLVQIIKRDNEKNCIEISTGK